MISGSSLVKEVYDGVYKKAELGKLGKENVRINKIRVLFLSGCSKHTCKDLIHS